MTVIETFFSVQVSDMARATAFYEQALGATVAFASPGWSSLDLAGVRLGLTAIPTPTTARVGLHFAVADLEAACEEVARAGGLLATPRTEVAPGVFVAEVTDTEGNTFTLTQR